jgi:WD40 repeat protein
MEELQTEIVRLTEELNAERARRGRLEEECDLLAEDNARLRSEMDNMRYNVRPVLHPHPDSSFSEEPPRDDSSANASDTPEVFVEGNGVFAQLCTHTVNGASSAKNVLSTAIFHSSSPASMSDTAFVGGVDAYLRGFSMSSGEEMFVKQLPGPVLFIDCQPPWIVCGMMDGSHMIGHLNANTAELSTTEGKYHSKYVIGVRFSPAATYMATASYDKSVNVFRKRSDWVCDDNSESSNPTEAFEKFKTMQFQETPESIVFASEHELIVGLRGLPHLLYIDLLTFTQRNVSLNEHDWDLHVSFAPLALSVSPCAKYLLVATDKHMHLVLKLGTNRRLRILTGHSSGDYGKPSLAWDASGSYIYSNSEEENMVVVYSVGTQRIERRLTGHTSIVRALSAHPTEAGVLVTGSYDKSVKFWKSASH